MIYIGLMKYLQEKSCAPKRMTPHAQLIFFLKTQTEVVFDSLHHRAGDGICSLCAVL